jgi:HAD superfamily hydrolase (TIGR01509 family)
MNMNEMKAVLFDMDGVVLDSKDVWFRAFSNVGGVSSDEFDNEYWGRDLRENLKKIGHSHEDFCTNCIDDYLDQIKPIPGAMDVLEKVNLKKALITNTTFICVKKMMDSLDMLEFFPVIITSDKVENAKPDPEPVRLASEKLGIKPSQAFMVGDSEEDMEAGSRAGCRTIGLGVDGDIRIETIEELLSVIEE